jgi:hypothetical protein
VIKPSFLTGMFLLSSEVLLRRSARGAKGPVL